LQHPAVHALQQVGQVDPAVQQFPPAQHVAQHALQEDAAVAGWGAVDATPTSATALNNIEKSVIMENSRKRLNNH
jgi:hypothetical protein